jgi:hypothetical protein
VLLVIVCCLTSAPGSFANKLNLPLLKKSFQSLLPHGYSQRPGFPSPYSVLLVSLTLLYNFRSNETTVVVVVVVVVEVGTFAIFLAA